MSLQAKQVTKLYGKQKALDSVSLEIRTGEIVGFLGPNGAGKSTLMKIITGYIRQDSGEIHVNSLNAGNPKEFAQIKRQIGYLPENNPLYPDMYSKEYLNFVAKIYGLKGNTLKSRVDEIIEITGLETERHKKIGALSKGYRQRIGLAAALIHNPEVLILDEPTTGLDPNQIIEIRNLISKVGKEKTIMLSTHIMQEVEAICRKVIIINKGKIVTDTHVSNLGSILKKNHNSLQLEFNKAPDIKKIKHISGVAEVEEVSKNIYRIEYKSDYDIRPEIFKYAVENKLILLEMTKKEESMEDIFREVTQ
jgi:ABC-2 type transport system ATP-binding protein